jgi:hypothetical protein
MKIIVRGILSAVVSLAPVAGFAQAVAFLSNLKGDVALDGSPRPALLAELSRGQKLSLGKDSSAAVMYIASGKEYMLKGPGEFQLKDTEVSGSSPMPPAVRSTEWRTNSKVLVQVNQTSAASVRMRSVGKPKEEPATKLLYPVDGGVSTLQPTFRWRAADPKQAGEITVQAVGEEKPVHVGKASGGSYRLPTKLKPQADYAWTYAVAGNELGSGRFRTLSTEAMQQVEKRRPADKAEFSDRVMHALLLQEVGATQEAQEAWAKLAQERSDLPELAALAK